MRQMNDAHFLAFRQAVEQAYRVFARYEYPGSQFCTYCYTNSEIEHLSSTDPPQLSDAEARLILWESWDHWENSEVFRHYLPRAMEAMGPPSIVDDLFPRHLPEVMVRLGFHGWPEEERRSVVSCLTAVERCLELSQRGRDEWSEAMGLLDESAAPGA